MLNFSIDLATLTDVAQDAEDAGNSRSQGNFAFEGSENVIQLDLSSRIVQSKLSLNIFHVHSRILDLNRI